MSRHTLRQRRLGAGLMGVPMLLTILLAILSVFSGSPLRPIKASAVPIPLPVYEIDAVSGAHHASLLNLPVGQPGVLQAPMPVDVDGDLIPDVTVAVNLINVDGVFLNPPQIGQIIAPNIQINRLITAPVLGQSSPPLRIQVRMTIKDVGGSQPDMKFSFGYDTGPGGSIPQFWKATVAGLDKMFNPIQAVIDTTGQQLGLHPGISDFRLGPIAAPYQGPLSVIGGFQQGTTNATIDLNYRPFPNAVQVTYGTDSNGQHITYAHGVDTEVDLTSKLNLTTATGATTAVARVDRLPRAIALDLNQTTTGGSVDYRSHPNARLPDVQVDLTSTSAGQKPLVARADIEQLPAVMHGEWNINAASKQAHAKFTASGTGVGAIEARVANYLNNPTKLVPWVPDQRQYASFQQVPITGGNEQLIMGRAERLRTVSFDQNGGGYAAHAEIGDGELPFVGHIGLDQRPTGPLIEGRAQMSPLPSKIDMSFTPPGADQTVNPMKVTYDGAQTFDVDAHVELRQPAAVANAVCGAANTICADFAGRSIPMHIEARVRDGLTTPQGQPESRIEVDNCNNPVNCALPAPTGAIQPDFRADVVLGQADAAPLFAHAELDGLSRYLRIRNVQGADQTLQRLEFHTCDYNYSTTACAPGTEDEIGAIRANVHDFITRPANLPPPASPAPSFVGVTARGDDTNPSLVFVKFEAVARMAHIKELQYVNAGGTFGVRTQIGGGKNLAVDADVQGIRLPALSPPANQRIDLAAHALVAPLPDTINMCFQNSGNPLPAVDGTDPVTAACQQAQPFTDQTLTKSPIIFDWHASSAFSVTGSVKFHTDKATGDPADDINAAAKLKIDNIPTFLTAKVAVPTGDTSGPVRVLTTGPTGSSIDVGLHGEYTVGGADCNDPNPAHDVACADATITKLPVNMSALIDSTKNASRVDFHACDFRFFDPTPACAPGTVGAIGVIAVDGHLVKGHPGPLGTLEPTTDQHQYAFLQVRQPGPDDIALRARARFEDIRNVFYTQSADGFDAGYDMGTGLQPLEMKVQADTRPAVPVGPLPLGALGLLAAVEILITNLPSSITVKQHGPGTPPSTAPMVVNYDASAPVRVQAHAQVFKASLTGPASNKSCGDTDTACVTLDVQNVPAHFQASIGQSETTPASPGGPIDHHTLISVQDDAVSPKLNVIADAVVGLPSTTPIVGSVPVRAHAELLGIPAFLTAVMDEHVTNPGQTNEQRDLQKVTVRTCQLQPFPLDDLCTPGTEGQLDNLYIEAQNFLTRPLDFPAPNAGINEPLWATVAARGLLFQAAINLINIREATYVNHLAQGSKGFRVQVGDDHNLQARVDIKQFPLGNLNFGNMAIQNATADVLANLLIKPLPSTIAICLRESGRAIAPPSGDGITAPCEDNQPFGATVGQPDHTPMSFAYRASVPITQIAVNADAALNGFSTAPGNPAIDARRLHGELTLDNIPTEITAHILTPADDVNGNAKGPLRVQYDAPTIAPGDPGINVHFRAHQTQGDSICQDPRPSATAMCVGADLINLPKHLYLRYEPDKLSDNFHAQTASDTGKMDFKNLELSSVKPKLDNTGARIPGKADVLVATGEILGIDENIVVDGNINMPHDPNKAGSIDLTASIKIDRITATVRNYIAPDPFTAPIPARPVNKHPITTLDTFTAQSRPLPDGRPEFKATADIHKVSGFGFHQIAAADGTPTGTSVIDVNFGEDFAARAYADIVTEDGAHITGDVLLEQIPAGMQVCFRGDETGKPDPAFGQLANGCDDRTLSAKNDGAFQFIGTPANPDLDGLDVDAFVRAAAPGGTNIVSGRLNIENIPYRIDGILPSDTNGGKLDIAAKDNAGAAKGIGQIKFNAASFDFPSGSGDLNSGYTSTTPGFVPLTNQTAPFPPATFSTEYTSAVAEGDPAGSFDFQAVGRLGDANDSVSSSRLQRIYSSATACTNRDNRPDFPLMPTNDGVSTYRCVGADLQQTDPGTPDPFALQAVYKTADGNIVQLRNAGINDLPAFFQVDIAKTKLVDGPNNALRRRCGSAASETAAYNAAHSTSLTQAQAAATIVDCMPPLVRFDQPLASARLFGVAEFGKPEDLATLATTNPQEALADTNAIPRGDGWGATTGDTDDLKGIRAKAVTVDPDAAVENDERTAARVSFRLPIPQSVTVDQVQSESVHGEADQAHFFDGSDLRFHYVVRDAAGNTIGNLGELSAMYQAADGSQVLLSRPCRANPHDRVSNTSLFGDFNIDTPLDCNTDYVHGLLIPGEIGISMYNRNNRGTGQKYIQIDGRLSTDESAAVRLLGNNQSVGRIEAEIKNIPGPLDKNGNPDGNVGPDDATFRVEFLMKGKPETPPTGTPPTPPGPPSECVLCITTNVFLAQAFVSFDFWPDHSKAKARRVEGTLNHDGAKNGLETHSFDAVQGGSNAAVEADAYLLVDPLNIYGYLNLAPTLEDLGEQAVGWVVDALDLPGWVEDILDVVVDVIADLLASLVNLDFTVESRLDATVQWRTSHATMRQNLLHVKVVNDGDSSDGTGNATIGPIDWYVHQLKLNANLGITIHTPWPFPDINIGLTFLTLYYIPAGDFIVPFLFKYLKCSGNFWDLVTTDLGPAFPGATISAGPHASDNVVIWPLWEPRLVLGGLIGNLINAVPQLRNLGGLFFCIPGADDGDIPLGPPGDSFQTVSGGLWPQHPIFDSDHLADSALTPGAPAGIGAPPADPPAPPDCTQLPTPVGCPPPPPPPTNGPDFTVFAGSPLAMCGIHAFGDLIIDSGGIVSVATAADSNNPTLTGANCAAADVGKLVITSDHITNHGTIDGNATQATQPSVGSPPVATTSATGNAGAGHGGAGGAGTPGTGGPAYSLTGNANPEKNQATSEVGAPGAATSGARPKGGGLIQLLANDSIVSNGTIRADAEDGVANTTGACASDGPEIQTDNPPLGVNNGEDVLVHHANTGTAAPAGAGSGGGIVLSAPTVDVRGTTSSELHANGGVGGDSKKGSSGGGGGGVVKLLAPVLLYDAGFVPAVTGGAAGTNQCAGVDQPSPESSAGGAGGTGVVIKVATPSAQAGNPTSFWNNGASITIPFQAKGAYQNAGGFDLVLCGLHTTTTTAPGSGNLADLFTVPTSNTVGNPCGTGATALATKSIAAGNSVINFGDALASINFSRTGAANNGLWGLYAVAVRPAVSCAGAAPDCAVSRLPQAQFDPSTSTTYPARVETVLGIDNSNPTVTITAPAAGFLTKSVGVGVSFDAADQDTPANQALSHVVKTECRNSAPVATQYVDCASGASFNLVPGNGAKTIQVRVTDGAGNTSTSSVSGILSNSPPTATATIQFPPNGTNGWYTNAPTITISGYSQSDGVPAETSSGPTTGPFRYRFDNLPEEVCTTSPSCVVPALAIAGLPAGTHQFHFAAVDALGNRLYGTAMQLLTSGSLPCPTGPSTCIKWDPDKPTSELDTVPAGPNVTVSGLGWYTTKPFVVISALDALGGSGLNQVKYRIDGAGSFLTYDVTNPPQLTDGIHTIEFFSNDLAGNVEATHTSQTIRVDSSAPDSTLTKAPASPDGLAGWYVNVPTVSIGGFDDHSGTGAPGTGMLNYRVDNGNNVSCNAPCNVLPALLGTGEHLVGFFATDAAGNVHSEGGQIIKVDTQAPDTTISLRSPVPDGLNSWYLSLPFVVLSAVDQPGDYTHVLPVGSGVASTKYQLDGVGPFVPYIGPFQVAGQHSLCVQSTDIAGNVETAKCLPAVKGDDKDPTTSVTVAGPVGSGGWYVGAATVKVISSDPVPGSGLVELGADGIPCYDVPGTHPAAGTCVSVDGRPFVPYTGDITLNEGVHRVLAYSVDAAGRRSYADAKDVNVDVSPPVTTARTLPPYSARNGWFRAVPRVVLRANDGDQTSGVASTWYQVDGVGPFQQYTGPFDIQNGHHTVRYFSKDAAGLQEATSLPLALDVDTTPPVAVALSPEPAIWLQLLSLLGNLLGLSPPQAKLNWTIGDAISSKASVRLVIFDVTGNVVRQLDGGTTYAGQVCSPICNITPGTNVSGFTMWDGKDLSLTGILPVGLYYYRVVVIDDAGNVAQSGESRPIQIKASLGL